MPVNQADQRQTVIAASDGTSRSAHVIGRAAVLAGQLDMQLVVAHVRSPRAALIANRRKADQQAGEPQGNGLGKLGRRLTRLATAPLPRTAGQAPLRDIEARMRDAGVAGAPRLLTGDAAEEISALAKAESAAFLVLGLHGKRRALDALRLTTMEKIVLATQATALIAHQPPTRPYRRVLALTDFSPASAKALAVAARIAPDARFHALHMLALPLGARFSPDDPACDAAITRAEQAREGFLATPGLPELAEPPLMVPGNLHEMLKLRAEETGADLICIGINSGRDGSRLGHYARDLMRAPPLDLLVARAAA